MVPKPTPWPTPDGIKGLDVSHWNGYPDFDKLRDQGMRFVFSKASQGTTIRDRTFRQHTKAARAAGLQARDIIGYTTLVFLVSGPIVIAGLRSTNASTWRYRKTL